MEFISILVWVLCAYGCYSLAKKQGRDTTLAAILGVLFGVFAIFGYILAGDKQ